jgi:hypothetical protein
VVEAIVDLMVIWKRSQPEPSLFDPARIDLVAAREGVVELHVVRDTPWGGSEDEVRTLQEKLQAYVGYALDGQMHTDYPETVGLPWKIVIDSSRGEPDERTAGVLEALRGPLSSYGGELELRVN